MKLFITLALLLITSTYQSQWSYTATSTYTDPNHSFFTAALKYAGSETHFVNESNPIIQNLNFTYFFASQEHLVIRITDLDKQRWEVPNEAPFPHLDYSKKFAPYENALVQVSVTENPFSFKITRKSTNEVVFDSSVGDFIYSDYYLQISTSLATSSIYGLGERAYNLTLGSEGTYSIFNKGFAGVVENGTAGHGTYGYHPVYMLREKSNSFSMALLRSSVPMDVQIQGGKTLTYKVVGGILDFQMFFGDEKASKPETVVKQYHNYLGGWTLQPFWSFGFHQCRWGYHNVSEVSDVLGNYSANRLPLDVIWSDIDYMENYIDFTVDPVNFTPSKMKDMVNKYQKKYVPIIDAGVALNNSIYQLGEDYDIYLRDPNGALLKSTVWPGEVNFPDFLHPNTSKFWSAGLKMLYDLLPFNGIWLDMNEVSGYVDGEIGYKSDLKDLLDNPPYKPTLPNDEIYTGTTRMDAVHYGNISEYYIHNMFGHLEAKATFDYLKNVSDLVFILTRSSFYGSGQFTSHWTGDNVASYEFMALSIPGIMNFGLYGIPFAGSDICGFTGNTTSELCARWFQLGTLYPFSRDHNEKAAIPQEPYALGPTVLETAKVTLALRYSIVRHYFTEFLKQNGTGTTFRPLFFEFPDDKNLYDTSLPYVNNQFLIGESLMSAPALNEGQTTVKVYFPQDNWFDFITGKLMQSCKQEANTVEIDAPLNATAPIFVRGGHIIPTQNVTDVNRTDDLSSIYQLNIAFKQNCSSANEKSAEGALVGIANFNDSNVLAKCRNSNCLYSVNAAISLTDSSYDATVSFTAQGSLDNYEDVSISSLFMMGDFNDSEVWSKNLHEKMHVKSNVEGGVKVEVLSNNVIKYTFDKPVAIQSGSKISLSASLKNAKFLQNTI